MTMGKDTWGSFAIFVTDHDGRQDLNIRNNAWFTVSKRSGEEVSYADPPLVGSWTHEHYSQCPLSTQGGPIHNRDKDEKKWTYGEIPCN